MALAASIFIILTQHFDVCLASASQPSIMYSILELTKLLLKIEKAVSYNIDSDSCILSRLSDEPTMFINA